MGLKVTVFSGCGRALRFTLCLCAILFLFSARPAKAIKSGIPLEINGTYVVYIVETRTFQATEQARLLLEGVVITADSMIVDLSSRGLRAIGNIRVAPVLSSSFQTDDPLAAAQSTDTAADWREGAGNILEGDTLYYDLDRQEGVLFQSENGVLTRQLFQGYDLRQVSSLISEVERFQFKADPRSSPINIVASRVRVQEDGDFQAWNTQVYVKGKKALTVPYYSSASQAGGVTGFSLSRVDYSSQQKWILGGQWRYKKHGKFRGLFNWGYASKATRKYSLGLTQNYGFGQKVSGTLGISGLGTNGLSYRLSMNARLQKLSQLQANYGHVRGSDSDSLQMFYSRFGKNTDQQFSLNKTFGLAGGSYYNYRWSRRSMPLKSLGLTYDLRFTWDKNPAGSNYSLYSNLYRSQINLGKKSWFNVNGSFGVSRGNQWSQWGYTPSVNASLTHRLGAFSQISLGQSMQYSFRNSTRGAKDSRSHGNNSTLSLALGGTRKWSLSTSAAYGWSSGGWSFGSFNFSRTINSKMDFTHSLSYDLRLGEPVSDTWSISYKILGVRARFNWFDNTGDYAVTFDSPF